MKKPKVQGTSSLRDLTNNRRWRDGFATGYYCGIDAVIKTWVCAGGDEEEIRAAIEAENELETSEAATSGNLVYNPKTGLWRKQYVGLCGKPDCGPNCEICA